MEYRQHSLKSEASSDSLNTVCIYHHIIAESRQLPRQVHARVHAPLPRAHGRALGTQVLGLYCVEVRASEKGFITIIAVPFSFTVFLYTLVEYKIF